MKIARAAGSLPATTNTYPPVIPGAAQNTTQLLLLDDVVAPVAASGTTGSATIPGYDNVGNPLAIQDNRNAAEWDATAMPVTLRRFSYDDAYRLVSSTSQFAAGPDSFAPPLALATAATSPMPLQEPTDRVGQQTYTYDGLGNIIKSTDDSDSFFDHCSGQRRLTEARVPINWLQQRATMET